MEKQTICPICNMVYLHEQYEKEDNACSQCSADLGRGQECVQSLDRIADILSNTGITEGTDYNNLLRLIDELGRLTEKIYNGE